MITHPIPPVFDKDSSILILGSFPSVRSREEGFFYGHPQNRLFGEEIPNTIDEKRALLLRNHIALWDVIGSCEIKGSSDSSIRDVTANDISLILDKADIETICLNGKKAEQYYKKYLLPVTGREGICLPSTSPANAAWNMEKLIRAWRKHLI